MSISLRDEHDSDQSLDFIDRRSYRGPMSQTTSPSTTLSAALDDLAWAIARDGIEQHEPAVARAVLALRSAGAVTRLLDLVADRDQPAVARERAFGRLGLPFLTTSRRDPRRLAA
jgi:hypothetical protein